VRAGQAPLDVPGPHVGYFEHGERFGFEVDVFVVEEFVFGEDFVGELSGEIGEDSGGGGGGEVEREEGEDWLVGLGEGGVEDELGG